MAWFRCFVSGENVWLESEGESRPFGFFTTRFVEAADADEAEVCVVDRLRHDPRLATVPGGATAAGVRIVVERTEETSPESVPVPIPGFVWYPMEPDPDGV